MTSCALCEAPIELFEQIFYAWQDSHGSYETALDRAESIGIRVDERLLRAHFQQHPFVQPKVRKRGKTDALLRSGLSLPPRAQLMLRLLSSVGPMTVKQAASLLYWDGPGTSMRAAHTSCQRDLKRLVLDGFVYKYHPDTTRTERLVYFISRSAIPYLTKIGLRPKPYMVTASHKEAAAYPDLAFHLNYVNLLTSLALQARAIDGASVNQPGLVIDVRFKPEAWHSKPKLRFTDTRAGTFTAEPACVGSFGVTIPERNVSLYCPFIFEVDYAERSAEETASSLLRYVSMLRSGYMQTAAGFPPGFQPPVIVLMHDISRATNVRRLLSASNTVRSEDILPPLFICDQQTFAEHASSPVWLSAWDMSAQRLGLLEMLLKSCSKLAVSGLTADSAVPFHP
jgi:hypothetical protein